MFSLRSFKKITPLNKGQAVIEAILMLVISVLLATGLLRQFSEPFREFIDGLFSEDGYYACLFQTASLPGSPYCSYPQLRDGDASWASGGGGSSGDFTSGGGNFLGSSNSFPADSTNFGSNDFSSNNSFSNNNPSSWDSNSTSPTINDWGNPNSGFTGTPLDLDGGGSSRFLAGNSNRMGAGGNNSGLFGDSNLSSNRFEDSENSGGFNRNQKRKSKFKSKLTSAQNGGGGFFSSRRGKYIISSGRLSSEQQEMQNRGDLITPSSAQKSSNNHGDEKKTFAMNPQIKAQEIEEDDEPFTFGKFIKYVMLGAVILVILFFIGSQTLSISENLKAS